jgi:hypothetical protein
MSTGLAVLLVVHLIATASMTGLIWFVQVVHYPLFARVGSEGFVSYESAHVAATSRVVGPPMAAEGVTAIALAVGWRDEVGIALVVAGLLLLAVIHASTVTLQVPAHRRLATGYDPVTVRRLVTTNWIRTAGWSARAAIAGAMIVTAAAETG